MASAAPIPSPLDAPARATEVTVRMYRALQEIDAASRTYRGLLGDCFLLTIRRGEMASNILIDCGILLGSPDAPQRMRAIAKDIVATCGGDPDRGIAGKLDLLVVTHEHWDHISGFSQAEDILLDSTVLDIGRVWMAWTERPDDAQATRLRRRFEKSGATFAALAERLRKDEAGLGADLVHRRLYGLDGFLGAAAEAPPGSGRRLRARAVIDRLRGDGSKVDFLEPGTVLDSPGPVALRTFVLGPPRDEELLFKDKPSAKTPETYLDAPEVDTLQIVRFAEGEDPDPDRDSPFAPMYSRITARSLADAIQTGCDPTVTFLRDHYFGTSNEPKPGREWLERRRIDTDWLGAAGALALKLDSDTNNTSLVLAFELPDEQRSILLFPGDAQVGNWLSWQKCVFNEGDRPVGETAVDLLGRTLLYKVGHHGSHNATLQAKGLELMTRDDLFALIPTDEALGREQGSKGWNMPDPRLYAALRRRTGGRILRSDRTYSPADLDSDPDLRGADRRFFDKVTETPLYLEYPVLKGGTLS